MGGTKQLVLGIEGGATRTGWVLCEAFGDDLVTRRTGQLGAANLRLASDDALLRMWRCLPGEVGAVGIFLAGCSGAADRERLRRLGADVWPGARLSVGSDRESGFAAAFGDGDGVLVIAGTGSAVTGRAGSRIERAGGWGHLLGDAGGGYDLAVRAIRQALLDYDTGAHVTPFARSLLALLGLNRLADLPDWMQSAAKPEVARVAPVVLAHEDDPAVAAILAEGAGALALFVEAVAHRLDVKTPTVRLTGGLFEHGGTYLARVKAAIRARLPGADVAVSDLPGPAGAARLAAKPAVRIVSLTSSETPTLTEILDAATEQLHPQSTGMDRMPVAALVRLFLDDAPAVNAALRGAEADITAAADLIAARLVNGGRLIYVGAGTSGRLGVLDASEIPPTFGVDGSLVQAIIAGGFPALRTSVEGAEDSEENGAFALSDLGVTAADAVCGVTASGRTPFVRGALSAATRAGAATVLVTCNPRRVPNAISAEVTIDLDTGPELLAGSTRLKAGTATKITLNILSTIAMIRLGRVIGNQMADVRATNVKLRERAIGIVATRAGLTRKAAASRLAENGWNVRAALDGPLPPP